MVYKKVKRKHSSVKAFDITGGYVFDFSKSMEADELTPSHIKETITRIAKAIDGCNFYRKKLVFL